MSAAVVFILFVICLVIAIPVSISLGIVAVLPGAFDSSFTASASYVIRSMLGGIDSFPLLAVPMFVLAGIVMAHGKISQKLFDIFCVFYRKKNRRNPMCGYHHLLVLWSDFRLCACNCCGCRKHDHSASYGAGLQKGFFNGNCCGCGRTRSHHTAKHTFYHVCDGNR